MSNAGEWTARLKAFSHLAVLGRSGCRLCGREVPVPDSKEQCCDLTRLQRDSQEISGELDLMTPAEIRAYQFNIEFTQKDVAPSALGTEEALGRQSEAVRTVSPVVGANAAVLANLSLADVQGYGRTAARHDLLKRRWLSYEVDAQKQFDYPEMSDASVPKTAAMIRAMRAADQERDAGNPADYKLAAGVP